MPIRVSYWTPDTHIPPNLLYMGLIHLNNRRSPIVSDPDTRVGANLSQNDVSCRIRIDVSDTACRRVKVPCRTTIKKSDCNFAEGRDTRSVTSKYCPYFLLYFFLLLTRKSTHTQIHPTCRKYTWSRENLTSGRKASESEQVASPVRP